MAPSGVGLGLDCVLSVPGVCCYSVIAEKLSASRVRFLKREQIVKALYASIWHRTSRLPNSANMAQEELSQRRNFQLRFHLSLFRSHLILNSLEDTDYSLDLLLNFFSRQLFLVLSLHFTSLFISVTKIVKIKRLPWMLFIRASICFC